MNLKCLFGKHEAITLIAENEHLMHVKTGIPGMYEEYGNCSVVDGVGIRARMLKESPATYTVDICKHCNRLFVVRHEGA